MQQYPLARELLLVGGGHSHVIFLRMLGMRPVPGLKVTLVSPDVMTPYSGMLPGLVAGHYSQQEAFIDLMPLCRFAGADFIEAEVTGLDPAAQAVKLWQRPDLHYDVLSVDVGSTPNLGGLAGEDVTPVKPISTFLSRWSGFLERFGKEQVRDIAFVGAGAGGVELGLAVNFALNRKFPANSCQVHLVTGQRSILPEFPPGVRSRFERLLGERNIDVHREFEAVSCSDGVLRSASGDEIRVDHAFWVTQAGAQDWPRDAGLQVDNRGFIEVDDTLRSISHPNVFAVGDCAVMVNHPRPRAGVFAVRQGKPLFHNIRSFVLGEKFADYNPQDAFLSLVTAGDRYAVACRVNGAGGYSAEGPWVWRWKDWIDRRFMRRFSRLPAMKHKPVNSLQAEFDEQMHCGGCGAKVSADLLTEVLDELVSGGAPAEDAAEIVVPRGMRLLQTVDHLRTFIDDPYLQARIAVIHALSDVYACGGRGLSVMALLTLPFAKPGVTRSMLTQVLRGVLDQLKLEETDLIGGHTSEGVEMSIGFAVNGVVKRGENWTRQGASPGDALVLTKPVGTGAVLAAAMQYRARGSWVRSAVDSMLVSNRQAVSVLAAHGVSACTDITGFGLAGHCREMLTGNTGALLQLDTIPVLEGARDCLGPLDIKSTLHEGNRIAAGLITAVPGADILFDPQTSGGLLAAIPASRADACLSALHDAGYHHATQVGRLNDTGRLALE